MFRSDLTDIRSTYCDSATIIIQQIELIQQEHQGGLAAAGAAKNAEGCSCFHGEVDIVEQLRRILVSEVNVLEADISVHRGIGSIRIIGLHGRMHDIGHTVNGNTCLTHFRNHAAKCTDRPYKHGIIGNESNVFAFRKASVNAEPGTENYNKHHLDAGDNIRHTPKPAHNLCHLDP